MDVGQEGVFDIEANAEGQTGTATLMYSWLRPNR